MKKNQTKGQQQRQFKEYLRQLFPEGKLTKTRQWAGKLNLAIRKRKIEGVIDLETLAILIMGEVYKQSGKAARKQHVRDTAKIIGALADLSAEISAANPNLGYCIVPAPASMAEVPFVSLKRMSAKTIRSSFYNPGWRITHAFISFSSNGNVEEAREESIKIRLSERKSVIRIAGWSNAGLITNGNAAEKLRAA